MSKEYRNLYQQLEDEMDRISPDAFLIFTRKPHRRQVWQPRADVCETDRALLVTVELAGLSAEQISRQVEVTFTPDLRALVVSGRRDEPPVEGQRVRCHQLEIVYGDFERVIPLPSTVSLLLEGLSAHYKDGLLLVELPKRPPQQPRIIAITSG